jgi:hypothetical protein
MISMLHDDKREAEEKMHSVISKLQEVMQQRLKEWSEKGDRPDSVVVRASASNSPGTCSNRSVGERNDNVQQRPTKGQGMECKKGTARTV